MMEANAGMAGLRRLRAGLGFALALGMAAQAQPGPGPDGPGQGGRDMEMMSPRMFHELHLSPDQEKKLKESRLAAQKRKIQLHSEKAMVELDLKNLLSAYPVNKAEAMKLAEKIAEADKKLTLLRVETLTQMLGSLTAEQHAKLQDIQAEWMERRRAWREEMHKDRGDRHDGKGSKGDGD
jgi:Spy/CpxP family protein refolding chaperone